MDASPTASQGKYLTNNGPPVCNIVRQDRKLSFQRSAKTMAAIKFIVFAKLVHCSSEILGALRSFLFQAFQWDDTYVKLSFGPLSRYPVTISIAKIPVQIAPLIHDHRAAKF